MLGVGELELVGVGFMIMHEPGEGNKNITKVRRRNADNQMREHWPMPGRLGGLDYYSRVWNKQHIY